MKVLTRKKLGAMEHVWVSWYLDGLKALVSRLGYR